MVHKGTYFSTLEDIKSTAKAELQKILKKLPTGASNHDRIDGASLCEHKGPTLNVFR
jgi:hypothetical protein